MKKIFLMFLISVNLKADIIDKRSKDLRTKTIRHYDIKDFDNEIAKFFKDNPNIVIRSMQFQSQCTEHACLIIYSN